jgi:DNA-binding NarL/FixJ family response regulator
MKHLRVLLIEDDPYARDMMEMLLARDWRTQLIGEIDHPANPADLKPYLEQRLDVVVLDTENPLEPERPFRAAQALSAWPRPPRLLFTATRADPQVIQRLLPYSFGGFLVKEEIRYSLATAIALTASGRCVLTPAAQAASRRLTLPCQQRVLTGNTLDEGLPPRTAEILRLALLFNLSQRDIADELMISPGWVAEAMSAAYQHLGLSEILSGQTRLEDVITIGEADVLGDRLMLERCRSILARSGSGISGGKVRKAPWMSTLAFHLLTRPNID